SQIDQAMSDTDRFAELLFMEDGSAKLALAEELVREADTHQNELRQFLYRKELVRSATFSGEIDKALVAFAWCLGKSDENPQEYSPTDLMWSYKWILHGCYMTPSVSAEQIAGIFADATRRFQEAGESLRPIYDQEARYQAHLGNRDGAKDLMKRSRSERRSSKSDCAACERSSEIEFHLFLKDFDRVAKLADDTIAKGLSCTEEPQRQLCYGAMAYQATGRDEDAKTIYRKWYPKVKSNRNYLLSISCLLNYLIRADNMRSAVTLFERHLSWAVEATNKVDAFRFFIVSHQLLERLQSKKRKVISVRGGQGIFPFQGAGDSGEEFGVVDLADWSRAEASKIADQFDARNGNAHFASLMNGDWPWGF
ncbi:MAG: hypothetical protein AAF585_21835, partial [Verrucomicrobiota bacterium]